MAIVQCNKCKAYLQDKNTNIIKINPSKYILSKYKNIDFSVCRLCNRCMSNLMNIWNRG